MEANIKAMNKPTDFTPVAEVIIYRGKKVSTNGTPLLQDTMYHALVADIINTENGPARGAIKDITEEDVRTLRKVFNSLGSNMEIGLLPENVLATQPGGFVWWLPAQKRPIAFTSDLSESVGIKNGTVVSWPALLFMAKANGGSTKVFAMKESKRPTGETELYKPPFWNVQPHGSICFGSAQIDTDTNAVNFIHSVEEAFFLSQFSHMYGSSQRLKKLTLDEAWKRATYKDFPSEQMLSADLTVNALLSHENF